MQVKNQHLELDMSQWTGSKLGKKYVKAVDCHPTYLTYMHSTSWEMLGWKKHKLESKLNIQKTKIMASGPITSWQIDGETVESVSDFIFWAPKSLQMVIAAMKLKDAYSLEGKLWPT